MSHIIKADIDFIICVSKLAHHLFEKYVGDCIKQYHYSIEGSFVAIKLQCKDIVLIFEKQDDDSYIIKYNDELVYMNPYYEEDIEVECIKESFGVMYFDNINTEDEEEIQRLVDLFEVIVYTLHAYIEDILSPPHD